MSDRTVYSDAGRAQFTEQGGNIYPGDSVHEYVRSKGVDPSTLTAMPDESIGAQLNGLSEVLADLEKDLSELTRRLQPALLPESSTEISGPGVTTQARMRSPHRERVEELTSQVRRYRRWVADLIERVEL